MIENLALIFFSAVLGGAVTFFLRNYEEKRNSKIIKDRIIKLCIQHLSQIKEDVLGHIPIDENKNDIIINVTAYNEMKRGLFLYDLLLSNIGIVKIEDYPKTVYFFHHYEIQLDNIESRMNKPDNRDRIGWLKKETFNKLLEYLDSALQEMG